MNTILCFGDSNTWGYAPGTGARYPWGVRWTGVLQALLGSKYRVVEEGLNGRTTTINEEDRVYRSGMDLLPVLLESHAPLDLVIIMLGTNDLKPRFARNPEAIAEDAMLLCETVKSCEFLAENQPEVLLISPTHINDLPAEYEQEFEGAKEMSYALADHFQEAAKKGGVHFLNASRIVATNTSDGVHWSSEQHSSFAGELTKVVRGILEVGD